VSGWTMEMVEALKREQSRTGLPMPQAPQPKARGRIREPKGMNKKPKEPVDDE